jgi:ferrochelatase
MTGLKRAESLNDFPVFIQALSNIFKEHVQTKAPVTTQMTLRCPSCVNETCGKSKEFFAQEKRL